MPVLPEHISSSVWPLYWLLHLLSLSPTILLQSLELLCLSNGIIQKSFPTGAHPDHSYYAVFGCSELGDSSGVKYLLCKHEDLNSILELR